MSLETVSTNILMHTFCLVTPTKEYIVIDPLRKNDQEKYLFSNQKGISPGFLRSHSHPFSAKPLLFARQLPISFIPKINKGLRKWTFFFIDPSYQNLNILF